MPRLLVVLNTDGLPLLSRALGCPRPTLPHLGLLSAVHTAPGEHGHALQAMHSDGAQLAFLPRAASLLVLVTSDVYASDTQLQRVLAAVYDMLTAHVGEAELAQANARPERLRRVLRTASRAVDGLVGGPIDGRGEPRPIGVGLATQCTPVFGVRQKVRVGLAAALLEFADYTECEYVALTVDGQLAVATDDYARLDARDRAVLDALLAVATPATCRDMPLFLPDFSPDVPYRLLTFRLTHAVEVVMLCGPDQDVEEIQMGKIKPIFGRPDVLELIRECDSCARGGRNVPRDVVVDAGITAFVAVHRTARQVLTYVSDGAEARKRLVDGVDEAMAAVAALGRKLDFGASGPAASTRASATGASSTKPLPETAARNLLTVFIMTTQAGMRGGEAAVTDAGTLEPVDAAVMQVRQGGLVAVPCGCLDMYMLLSPVVPRYAWRGLAAETAAMLLDQKVLPPPGTPAAPHAETSVEETRVDTTGGEDDGGGEAE